MTTIALRAGLAARIALVALVAATAVQAEPSDAAHADIPVEGLKQVYLGCEQAAALGDADTSDIMRCSVVYEQLKRRAFGGDFRRFKAWSDAQLAARGS